MTAEFSLKHTHTHTHTHNISCAPTVAVPYKALVKSVRSHNAFCRGLFLGRGSGTNAAIRQL